MRVKECIINVLWEILYSIVMIIYLVRLDALNKELLSQNFRNAFVLLQYKDYAPLMFFGVALCLFLIGGLLIVRRFRRYRWGMDSFEDIIMSILAVTLVISLLVLLFIFIDNPILRAVFVAVGVVLGAVFSGE